MILLKIIALPLFLLGSIVLIGRFVGCCIDQCEEENDADATGDRLP